jgi:hypothetical protein
MNTSITALKFPRATGSTQTVGAAQPGPLRRFGMALWQALESVGRSRARRELALLADRWESARPELAAQLRTASLDSLRD